VVVLLSLVHIDVILAASTPLPALGAPPRVVLYSTRFLFTQGWLSLIRGQEMVSKNGFFFSYFITFLLSEAFVPCASLPADQQPACEAVTGRKSFAWGIVSWYSWQH
jgi:hypothetical protein